MSRAIESSLRWGGASWTFPPSARLWRGSRGYWRVATGGNVRRTMPGRSALHSFLPDAGISPAKAADRLKRRLP